jgi:hypothetical protein
VKAVEQGFSAQFYRFDELLVELKRDAALPPARLRRRKYLSTAILDRLLHRAHVLNIKGRSYRLRDLEQALAGAHA